MEQIFKQDNPFFDFMSLIGDLMLLNILWIISSLPIVTIGASTCALFYNSRRILEKRGTSIIKNYFKSFKENFANATILWIPLLIFGFLLFCLFSPMLSGGIFSISLYIFITFLYLTEVIYVFALQATFVNTPLNIVKNAFLTAFGNLKFTLFVFAITYIPMSITLLLPSYFYITFLFWVCIGFALIIFLQAYLFQFILKKYME